MAALLGVTTLTVLGACGAEDPAESPAVGSIDPGPTETVPIGGDDPTLSDETVDAGDDAGPLTAALEITAGVGDDPGTKSQALLDCGPEGAAGTLWLEGDAAEDACQALEDASVVAALLPADDDEDCPAGGDRPDVATVVGVVQELQVDAVVDDSDGCAERFDLLAPLLPSDA